MWNIPKQKVLKKIPFLYSTENTPKGEKLIYLHFSIFFCDWYVAEFDGIDTFFGYIVLNNDYINAEWGYFSFSELKSIRIKWVEVLCTPNWNVRPAHSISRIR